MFPVLAMLVPHLIANQIVKYIRRYSSLKYISLAAERQAKVKVQVVTLSLFLSLLFIFLKLEYITEGGERI